MRPDIPRRQLEVLTLNIARPNTTHAESLLAYLWERPEPLLVLTEAGTGSGSTLIAAVFREAGHAVYSSVRNRGDRGVLVIDRGCGFAPDPAATPDSFAERVLVGNVGDLRIAGVYGQASDPVRYASREQRQRKREWLLAYASWLVEWLSGPSLVIGDLNIVDPDFDARLPYVLGEERAVYRWMIDDLKLTDAFRAHNRAQASWFDHSGAGCRYDHAFASPGVHILTAELDHFPRTGGFTDHAALHIDIGW